MKCPHCLVEMHPNLKSKSQLGRDPEAHWEMSVVTCPACDRIIITLYKHDLVAPIPGLTGWTHKDEPSATIVVHPRYAARPISPKVPAGYAKDFNEAAAVLTDSPNASAALSRRCLQKLIREQEGIKGKTLNDEIDELLHKDELPSYIALDLHTIRRAGNVATHPMMNPETGIVADVEPWEADYLLNILENLFDHYFVKPDEALVKRERIAAKYKTVTAKKKDEARPDESRR